MKFKCKNCNGYCLVPKKYKNGKDLQEKENKLVDIKCEVCKSRHTISMCYLRGVAHNTLGYYIDYERKQELFISNGFRFEETENSNTLNGYITHCYLILGFDKEKELKKKID